MEQAELTPGLAATLRHAASINNPVFYERQRMRAEAVSSGYAKWSDVKAKGRAC